MARRVRKDDELGPQVPRWAVEYRAEDWPDYATWQWAAIDWADEHLRVPGHIGPWMDVTSNALRLEGDHGAAAA